MYQSRQPGWAGTMSKLYREMATKLSIDPPTVDRMRPSHVAALLGLDELDAAEGEEYVRPRPADPTQAGYVPPPERDPNLDLSIPRAERLRRRMEALEAEKARGGKGG